MITDLVQGETYYIPFVAPYTSKGPYDVKVSAIARKSTLDLYGDFDIREAFFSEVGIKTYLTMVTDETDIYICHEVKNFDPPEIDEENFIFIPKSLVDFANVDTYKITNRYAFTIEGIRRSFDSTLEKNDFIENLEVAIPNALQNETILANDILSISESEEELLVRKTVLYKEEKNREDYIKMRQNQITTLKQEESAREMDYYRRVQELKKREELVAEKEKTIAANLKFAESSKQIGNAWLDGVNQLLDRIRAIYTVVQTASNKVGLTTMTWEEMMIRVYDPIAGGVDLKVWKELAEQYMQTGVVPEEWEGVDMSNCPICGSTINEINGTDIELKPK